MVVLLRLHRSVSDFISANSVAPAADCNPNPTHVNSVAPVAVCNPTDVNSVAPSADYNPTHVNSVAPAADCNPTNAATVTDPLTNANSKIPINYKTTLARHLYKILQDSEDLKLYDKLRYGLKNIINSESIKVYKTKYTI